MSALIYFEDSGHVVKRYKTMPAAKAALTKGRRRGHAHFGIRVYDLKALDTMAVCTRNYFDSKIDYDVVVQSLMSGKDVTIKRSEAGGCTDPSTERYWSM